MNSLDPRFDAFVCHSFVERIPVDKKSLAGVSLVAALPAAWATFLMVQFFLTYVSDATWTMIFLVTFTMLIAVTLALLPVGIFVKSRGPGKTAAPAKAKPAVDKTAMTAEVSAEMAATGEFESSAEFANTGELEMSSEFEQSAEFSNTGEFETSSEFEMSSDELITDDFEDSEAFELDDDDEDQK